MDDPDKRMLGYVSFFTIAFILALVNSFVTLYKPNLHFTTFMAILALISIFAGIWFAFIRKGKEA